MKNQEISTSSKNCLFCHDRIQGRTDKKFCNDYCRSAFNNQHAVSKLSSIRSITHILVKNRKVLEKWANKKRNPVKLQDVLSDGLNLTYCTQTVLQPVGNPHCFCYDYGYQLLPNDQCRILQQINR
jgi:hypothetical protein